MNVIVSFEDNDNTYTIPMDQIIKLLKLDITVLDVEAAIREALK